MGAFSISHWLIVMVVVLLVFGPKRLSEVGKGLGQGVRNFKAGLGELDVEDSAAPAKRKARRSDAVSKAASSEVGRGHSSETTTSSESEPPRA